MGKEGEGEEEEGSRKEEEGKGVGMEEGEEGERTVHAVMPGHHQGVALRRLYVQIMLWSGAFYTVQLALI